MKTECIDAICAYFEEKGIKNRAFDQAGIIAAGWKFDEHKDKGLICLFVLNEVVGFSVHIGNIIDVPADRVRSVRRVLNT